MTVIAWDGRTLAADKWATYADGHTKTNTKISRGRLAGELLAVTGSVYVTKELCAWYLNGADPAAFPSAARDGAGDLIVFTKDCVSVYCSGPYPAVYEGAFDAFGAGRECARTAMYLGCDAVRAVEIACHFRGDCGGGIDVLELEP